MKMVWSAPLTLLMTLAIGTAFVVGQVCLLLLWALGHKFFGGDIDSMRHFLTDLTQSGLFYGVTSILDATIIMSLIAFFVRLRRGFSFNKYLALETFLFKDFLLWLGIALCWMLGTSSLLAFLGYPEINPFVEKMYRSCAFLPLLWIGVGVAAPLGEEFLARGFLFQGLAYSRLGLRGAIIISSALWTMAHMQYELVYLIVIFGIGIIFGLARYFSGSLWVPLILHILWNLNSLWMTHLAVK